LIRHGGRVTRIAGIDLQRNRTPLGIRQHAVDHAGQIPTPIAVVAETRQQTGVPEVRTAADVVEHSAALGEVPLGKFALDPFLSREQPIQGRVQFIDLRSAHAQLLGQRGRLPPPGGGQLRAGMKDPLRDHGHHQVAFSAGTAGNQGFQSQPAEHGQYRTHVPVRQRADHVKGILCGDERFSLEDSAEQFDLLQRQGAEVGQRPVLHLAVFSIAFAEEVGGRRMAIRDFGNIHADIDIVHIRHVKVILVLLHDYILHFSMDENASPTGIYVIPEVRTSD
jgi:hypothetical protein